MLLLSSVDEYLKRESRVVGEIVKWREYIYTSWITVHKIATQMCVKQFRPEHTIILHCGCRRTSKFDVCQLTASHYWIAGYS